MKLKIEEEQRKRRREAEFGRLMVGVGMIIKGLFRKYERWNPVHPTSGAFWGMGLGVGCGVGWGPGFGPQVVGYVGAGCGIGFSVGITFAGFGIGLPAQLLPCKALTRSGALDVVLLNAKSLATNGWTNVSSLHREATSRFQNTITSLPIYPHLGRFHFPSFGPHKGSGE